MLSCAICVRSLACVVISQIFYLFDCPPSAEAQTFEDEWQQKVSVKPQPFGPGRHLEEPRSRVAPMAAITGPEQANRLGRIEHKHTDGTVETSVGIVLCCYAARLNCSVCLFPQKPIKEQS